MNLKGKKHKVIDFARDKTNRYRKSEENVMMIEIKKKIIHILHKIVNV